MGRRAFFLGRALSLLLVLMLTVSSLGSLKHVEARENPPASSIKHFIYVPMTRQDTDYTCGVTALQSILGYYGFDKRLGELASILDANPEKGTNYLHMASYAKAQGFAVEVRMEMTLDELKGYIDQKKPVLLAIQAWADDKEVYLRNKNEDGHYVVAIGYDDRNVYFMDPSTLGHYTYIPTGEFVSRWHDYDSYGKQVLTRLGIIITKPNAAPYDPDRIMSLD